MVWLFQCFVLYCYRYFILLPFLAMLSMTVISSLNDQYGCRSFCTSTLVAGQSRIMSSDSMPMYCSSGVAILISSVVMQSDMSVHDSIVLMVMHMPQISLSLFVFLLCLDSQSVMNNYGLGLYSIHILYCCIINSILWCLCDGLAASFLKIGTSALLSVILLICEGKTVVITFCRSWSMLSVSLSMLL